MKRRMANLYLPEEILAELDRLAAEGLVLKMPRSRVVAEILRVVLRDPSRVIPDLVRKPVEQAAALDIP